MHRNRSTISIWLNLLLVLALLTPSALVAKPFPSTPPARSESDRASGWDALLAATSGRPATGYGQLISAAAAVEGSEVDLLPDTALQEPLALPGDTSLSAANPVPGPEIRSMQAAGEGQSSMFIENVGQFDVRARFQLRGGPAGTVYLADDGIWLTALEPLPEPVRRCAGREREPECVHLAADETLRSRRGVNVRFSFVGANPHPEIVGINPLATNVSYFMGNDPDKWRGNVPVYQGVRYQDIYPGIDIEYTVSDGAWQTTLIAQPGADLAVVDLEIQGATARGMQTNGLLQLDTTIGPVKALPLLPDLAGTETSRGDFSQPLLLEHGVERLQNSGGGLVYSTFLGGSYIDESFDIAVDSAGYAYVAGRSDSSDFPTTPGAFDTTGDPGGYHRSGYDLFVVKLNPTASAFEFATYIGGNDGDYSAYMVIDDVGNTYLTGYTYSHDFPTTEGAYRRSHQPSPGEFSNADVYVLKLNATGSALEYSTLLGGSQNVFRSTDVAHSIAIDGAGNAYITGSTENPDFPTTSGAFNTSHNGYTSEAFVTKLNATGSALVYSTFLGGAQSSGTGITVAGDNTAYITGFTNSSDFPTTPGVFDASHNGSADAFIIKLNATGSDLDFGTFLGGSSGDYGNDIVHDRLGNIYVTGHTNSSNFPTTPRAFDTSHSGGDSDIFVVKLNATGTAQIYGTFLGEGFDLTPSIALDRTGNIYVTGGTASPDFPTTPDAFAPSYNGGFSDAFVVKLNTSGSSLDYATFLGGGGDDFGYGVAIDEVGGVYTVGKAGSSDFPTTQGAVQPNYGGAPGDGFVTKLGLGGIPLYPGQDWSAYPECPVCNASDATGTVGGPINTRDGNLNYQEADLSIPVLGGALTFRRSYVSQATDVYTRTMGHGWTHNYDMRLHFTGSILTDTVAVELQAPGGSRLPFLDNGAGGYTAYAGVMAQLGRITTTNPITTHYVVTAFNQMVYTFDYAGLLLQQEDAGGNVITFTHNAQGQLAQATQGTRSLTYAYDATTGYLSSVTDNAGRRVQLGYENGNLTVVTDTLGLATTYYYDATASPYLLTQVVDPSGVTVEETAYDAEGRAYRQWDGAGNLLVDINFAITNTHVITENGVVMTHIYDNRGTLVDSTFSCADGTSGCGSGVDKSYDYNFKASHVVDANGNATSLSWDPGGSNLEQVTDALGNVTALDYDNLNNLTQVTNARALTTTYGYESVSFPTFRTRMTDALGNTTLYTPTVDGLLAAEQDANGNITTYAYDAFGQVTEVVQAAGTGEAMTTTYGYDTVGRLITTTERVATESHTALNVYDDGDRLIATIANWTGSNPALWPQDCDTTSGPRDGNVCTRYGYDAAGRVISTTNTLGQTDLTFYDSAGRVTATVANWDGNPYTTHDDLCNFVSPDPEHNVCSLTGYDQYGRVVSTTNPLGHVTRTFYNSLGRVAGTVENSVSVTALSQCAFPPAAPDQDLCTTYDYDAAGNTTVVTDPLGRQMRTFYDELNRVAGTITNWSGAITETMNLADCFSLPAERDEDVCTLYAYDEVGNTTVVTDALGRQTRTFYDVLNRGAGTVQNWQVGFTLEDCFDGGLDPHRDENVCTLYVYDATGNQTVVTNAEEQRSLTVYDSANRLVVQVQNWDGVTVIDVEGDGCADTAMNPNASENLCTFTEYDALGRRASVTDVLGHVTTFAYDGLGRVVTTTRTLDGAPVQTVTAYDALGNRLSETDANGHSTGYGYDSLNRLETTTSHEGVVITQSYNAAGWLLATTDGLSHTTTNGYDGLGRLSSATDAENNTTQYAYDAAGNQAAMVDAEGVRTGYGYDGLHRLVSVVENDTGGAQTDESNLLTQYAYDALGNRTVITNARGYSVTHTVYDALNRPVIVYDALSKATQYSYDLLGNRTTITDANGAVTHHSYDALNRLITTTYQGDGVTVGYQYDAAGNRLQMVDDVGATTYAYDDFSRLITVTNPITGRVGYRYDAAGNRTQLIYPDGRAVAYTYDGDNRLVAVADWNSDLTTYQYDTAGRLITTTLPNGVVTVNAYDDANRLVGLSHTDSSREQLLSAYAYELDGLGNRLVATETMPVLGPHQLLTQTTVTAGPGTENWPAVAYNSSDNEYLVTWRNESVLLGAIYGQRLDATGNLVGDSVFIANGADAAVAYSVDDNGYLVVWGDGGDIWARPVSADGTPGTTFKVYDGAIWSPATQPAVAYNPTGGLFLVTWQYSVSSWPVVHAILARAVPMNGSEMGEVITVAEEWTGLGRPRAAADGLGNYLIVWQDERGSSQPAIYGQRLSDTALIGHNFVVRDTAAEQVRPDVAWDNESQSYLVVWLEDEEAVWGQRVDGNSDLLGDVIQFSNEDSSSPRVTAVSDGWLVAWAVNGPGTWGPIGYVAVRGVAGDGPLPGTTLSMSAPFDEVTAVAVVGDKDYLAAWAGSPYTGGGGASMAANLNVYGSLARRTTQLEVTVIDYSYDPLYRLSDALYSGAITATFAYDYDPVGNMTAFTETVGAETTRVSRTFDAANRLQTALDLDAGTTSYYYDDNGNLTAIYPPGSDAQNPAGVLHYDYDQRNLLITHTTYVSGTGWVLQAEYVYDGSSDRLQQVDGNFVANTGASPVTTTYTNDIFGLTQVLVADDGTAQVYNLFGLDLISQDSGGEVQSLLVDGLGSVRLEMVGGVVEAATTYEPYGQVLAQVGTSGTVYGFTGEQEDAATGLLYLRARYYSVELKTFMGRDQWEGNGKRPGTLNYYIYVENNPTNYTDPSGLLACEAPQAGCSQWVRYALNKIESVPLAVGKELVQNLWSEDRRIQYIQSVLEAGTYMNDNCSTLLPPHTPGFRIIFTDNMPWPSSDNFGMVTRPWAIFIKTSKFNPPNPPRGADILLLAHELVHLEQGPHFAMSVLGEVLAYQIEGDLRNYIAPGSTPSNAENSAAAIDLADPAILFNYRRWEQMWSDLVGWQNSNTNYANVPFILPPLGNPFPPPVGAGYPY